MQYPQADTIHLVIDNLNIHCRKSLTDLLGDETGGEVWIASPSTTPRNTVDGSIRQRLKSASSRDNASANEEFPTSLPCAVKPTPGIGASITPAPESTGSSTAKPRAGSSATKEVIQAVADLASNHEVSARTIKRIWEAGQTEEISSESLLEDLN